MTGAFFTAARGRRRWKCSRYPGGCAGKNTMSVSTSTATGVSTSSSSWPAAGGGSASPARGQVVPADRRRARPRHQASYFPLLRPAETDGHFLPGLQDGFSRWTTPRPPPPPESSSRPRTWTNISYWPRGGGQRQGGDGEPALARRKLLRPGRSAAGGGQAGGSAGERRRRAPRRAHPGGAPGVVDLTGGTTLAEAAALLKKARLAVCNDSGLMHLAAAVGTPIISIFGPTHPGEKKPLQRRLPSRSGKGRNWIARPATRTGCSRNATMLLA